MEVFDNQSEEHPLSSSWALVQQNCWAYMKSNLTLSFAIASSSNTSLRHLEIILYLSNLELNRRKITIILY